jgi:hypothetical protein
MLISSKIIVRWFVIGFIVRLGLAVLVTLLMRHDLEASMLYLLDIPTVFCLDVAERLVSRDTVLILDRGHPYYVPMNVLGSALWGFLFVLIRLMVAAVRGKWVAAKNP